MNVVNFSRCRLGDNNLIAKASETTFFWQAGWMAKGAESTSQFEIDLTEKVSHHICDLIFELNGPKRTLCGFSWNSIMNFLDILALLQNSLGRAMFLFFFIRKVRLSGVRNSMTTVHIRKIFKSRNIFRFTFFLEWLKTSIQVKAPSTSIRLFLKTHLFLSV